MMKKKWFSFFLFSLLASYGMAQTKGFASYSQLDTVKSSGFYNIEITAEMTAQLNINYSDLRIINDSGKWVPHILHITNNEKPNHSVNIKLQYTKTEYPGTGTVLLIQNGLKKASGFGLVMTNTAAQRFCTVSGSNDKLTWFVINDSILLDPIPVETAVENTATINFPPNDYLFYKVEIQNNHKAPFDIKGIVQSVPFNTDSHSTSNTNENPATIIQQKDSGKISYIKISQQKPYHFDMIKLALSGTKYFSRNVGLYIPAQTNHSFSNMDELVHSFTISNNSTLEFNIAPVKTTVFYLQISNEDNLPLKVKTVNTFLSERFITAYLEKSIDYKLIMNNTAAIQPNYDLSEMNTGGPDSISFLKSGKIYSFEKVIATPVITQKNNWVLWASIILVLCILLFFTTRMTKEINKRKKEADDHI